MTYLALACGYLAACFIAAALLVRWTPNSLSAVHVQDRLWLFPALPVLLILDVILLVGDFIHASIRAGFVAFETLSGRKHRGRGRREYNYFSYGNSAKRSQRNARPRRQARMHQHRRRLRA